MEHLRVYENEEENLDDLIYDLRDLGIGEDKVYIELYEVNNSEFYSIGKITFPKFNRIKGSINYEDIIKYLKSEDYDIKSEPGFIPQDYSIKELLYEIFTYNEKENLTIEVIIKDIANFLIGIAKVNLLVDGKIIISREREQRYL